MPSGALAVRPLHRCCLKCRGFFAKIGEYPQQVSSETLPESVDFHNIEELKASARAGCHLCSLIETELSQETTEELQQQLRQHPDLRSKQIEAIVWVSPRNAAPYSAVEGPLLRLQEAWVRPSFINKVTIAEFKYVLIESERDERR